jgi:hypothetical protein
LRPRSSQPRPPHPARARAAARPGKALGRAQAAAVPQGKGVGTGAGADSIAATASGASLPGQIATTLTGSGVGDSMGIFLPLIIAAVAVGGIAYALVRRRSSVS